MLIRELIHESNEGSPKYEYKAVFLVEYVNTSKPDTVLIEEKESYVLFARQPGYERWETVGRLEHSPFDNHESITGFDPEPDVRFDMVPRNLFWLIPRRVK